MILLSLPRINAREIKEARHKEGDYQLPAGVVKSPSDG